MEKNNAVKPMRVTTEKGEVYTLEFDRDSVKFAEGRGFDISEIGKFPQTNIPSLWFYSFRKNHKNMARSQTDALLAEMGGLAQEEIERLIQLYSLPTESLIITEAGGRKNSKVTVEL